MVLFASKSSDELPDPQPLQEPHPVEQDDPVEDDDSIFFASAFKENFRANRAIDVRTKRRNAKGA